MVAKKRPSATRRSCRSLAWAIGDQISFLNFCPSSPHGKANMDGHHQMSERLPGTRGARFEYSISMLVQANDWSATQCNPIAQQSAPIVAMRPIWLSTIARLGLANFDVNHCFAPAFGAKAPLPSSRYIVEPTREIRSDCRQIPAVKSFLASIVFVSVFPPAGT